MANDALVPEKTRVEKVNDAYHYYLTFKDLRFGAQVGTVDTLSVDNTAAERTDLGGEGHEKVFHFTSPEKLTEKTITFSVLVDGKPLRGHSNVPATLKFNWDAATPLTADQVTSLHNDETTKAQAEKERLEREKAEADRLEKERLDKEAAAKAQAEKEKLEKEKAEAARLEKERLEKEKAKLEEVKKEAVKDIANDKSLSKEEAKQLEAIVKTASLKDTLVAKVVENGSSEEVTVTFDNTAIKAANLVVEKADKATVAKVEDLVKKADENLSVVKTIDLHFADSKGNTINKQGETRAVTVAVVANENEKLEVYYVNGEKLEKVPSVYKDGKLTFFTNHFSLYTIVKFNLEKPSTSDTSNTSTNGNTSAGTETPKSSEVNPDKASAQSEKQTSQDKALNNENKATSSEDKKDTTNVFGQENNKVENNENKLNVVKTNSTPTPQNVEQNTKASLAKTGLSTAATAGLGALLLLSALVLRRKSNK